MSDGVRATASRQPATREPGLASRPGPAGECQAQEEPDRVWCTLPDSPKRPFGSALSPEKRGVIITPMLITEPTKRITRPELRKLMGDDE